VATAKRASFKDYGDTVRQLGDWKGLGASARPLLVYGTSEFLTQHTAKMLREHTAAALGAQIVALEASDLTADSLRGLCGQASLFEPTTMYLVRRCEQARGLPGLLKTLPTAATLANHLVFFYRGDSPAAPLRTELKRLGCRELPCFDPWPSDLPQAVQAIARTHDVKLASDAVALLIETIGGDLVKLGHEIARLGLLHASSTAPLTAAVIAPSLGLLREDEAFRLDRLLVEGRGAEAHALIDDLIARGEKAIPLLGILASHCRNGIRAAEGAASGLSRDALAAKLRLHPTAAKSYAANAAHFDRGRYAEALRLCQEADLLFKSSNVKETLVLGRIVEALRPPPGASA
jgi:DNA polymerase III delta subunit